MSIVMAASMLSTLRLYQLVSGSKASANPFVMEWMGAAFEVWGYSCPSRSFFKAAAASSLRPSFWYARASRKYAWFM